MILPPTESPAPSREADAWWPLSYWLREGVLLAVKVVLESACAGHVKILGKCLFLPLLLSSQRLLSVQSAVWDENKPVFLRIFA